MIYARIMRNDISRKLGAMVIVFLFILLSALLIAGGTSLIASLNASLDRLLEAAQAPHFVQMHAGKLEKEVVADWAESRNDVEAYQIAEMITVDGSQLYLGGSETAEEASVMDISFVRQNGRFDFLLDSRNQAARIGPGEVGVPGGGLARTRRVSRAPRRRARQPLAPARRAGARAPARDRDRPRHPRDRRAGDHSHALLPAA